MCIDDFNMYVLLTVEGCWIACNTSRDISKNGHQSGGGHASLARKFAGSLAPILRGNAIDDVATSDQR